MVPIIPPIPREALLEELSRVSFIRPTCKAGNLIYDFTAHEAPMLMREVARLRELSYRTAGGSTGQAMDIDFMDTMERPYHQLIVWDPDHQEIVGGYRWLALDEADTNDQGQPVITSSHLFYYAPAFMEHYAASTIELGRAFVQPLYHTREMGSRSLFALDNLWDGLGAIVCLHPKVKYLFGKVTIYPDYDARSRDLIYAFLHRFNLDADGLARPYQPVPLTEEARRLGEEVFTADTHEANYKLLLSTIRSYGFTIPPLFSAYLNLCLSLRFFGNAINDELANVYETGILVPLHDIHPDKHDRHIGSYLRYLSDHSS